MFYVWLARIAAVATYLLIVLGAVVRVTGSGLGCPDWPLCHGQLIPPLEFTAIVEYSHRLMGALVSSLILAVCAMAWATRRREQAITLPATLVPILLAIQIGLGAVVVKLELPAMVVLVHLGFAIVILGLLIWIAVWSAPRPIAPSPHPPIPPFVSKSVARLIWTTTALVFILVLSGAYVRASGATWACVGFPTCNGQPLPFGTSFLVDIHLIHRLIAYFAAWLIGLSLYNVWRRCSELPALKNAALAAGGLVVVQIGIGAVAVTSGVPPLIQGVHVAGATAVWVSMVVLAAMVARHSSANRSAPVVEGASPARGGEGPHPHPLPSVGEGVKALPRTGEGGLPASRARSAAAAYLQLTKPRVMVLLLITTLASMMVAAGGLPAVNLVFFTLLGGALASGGAGAINHYLDRDIDELMGRTSTRPIPSGEVSPRGALIFGILLGALSFAVLSIFVNMLSALLSIGALLFYVFVYTRWLKRSTPSNIVIGGAAGAVPPLVGCAAVTGEITLLALYLFAIVFFWTPPHFWALALLMRREYERAQVPMLPIVRGDEEARRQILLYSLQLVAITVVLFSFQLMGLFYLLAALVLGGIFIYYAIRLWRDASAFAARRLFKYSILYLTLLFGAMVVDRRLLL